MIERHASVREGREQRRVDHTRPGAGEVEGGRAMVDTRLFAFESVPGTSHFAMDGQVGSSGGARASRMQSQIHAGGI